MTEKSFYPDVQDCAKKNIQGNLVWELKLVKKNRFYYTQMEPHQCPWLYAAKHHTVAYKIPDGGFDRKPCDGIQLSNCPAYVVILFYIPWKKKHLCFIDIDVFLDYQKSGNVSMTNEEATTLASHNYHL